ncbi:MAG: NfeD family protein [Acetobacteraceae bacterium]|nr:NfeD family protein [Acetobacteraceae bacterium]
MEDGHWWLLGGVAGLITEALLPGFFLLWLGLAAICTGIVTLLLGVPFEWQVVSYVCFASAAVTAGLKLQVSPHRRLNTPTSGLVGRKATALTFDGPDGRVRLGDSDWPARLVGKAAVTTGASLRVVGVDGTLLLVEPDEVR